jgi:divalent metal cation (Fe/Co/Zn/Cd) transporter
MKGLLIGEAASPATIRSIEQAFASASKVEKVIHFRTQHLGPDELLVAGKLAFNRDLDVPALAEAINECEQRVREAVPTARVIYIEPDVERATTGEPVT